MQQTSAPPISVRANIWIVIPIAALIAAILTANFLFLNYVHIFSSILWTGTDIFMAFLLGPILRNVSLSTRKEVISWLISKMGLITLQPPTIYWISAVLVIVTVMMIQGLGVLLPTNLRVYFELRKSESDMLKIQKLMKRYVKVVAIQAALQFTIIFIMAEFATGFS